MAKITTSKCKLCRREGVKLFLKGERCESSKCAFERRAYAPGVHGPGRPPRVTDYGKQLREKQKAKRIYGISETQFANYYKKAMKLKGDSGKNLLRLLETRLDNVLFRAGFAKSRAAARQLVAYSHMTINGVNVNIPSIALRSGDIIAVRKSKLEKNPWKNLMEELKNKETLSWLVVNLDDLSIKVTSLPTDDDFQALIDLTLIIEYYSR